MCVWMFNHQTAVWYRMCLRISASLRISSCFIGPVSVWFRHCHIILKKPHEMSAVAISFFMLKRSLFMLVPIFLFSSLPFSLSHMLLSSLIPLSTAFLLHPAFSRCALLFIPSIPYPALYTSYSFFYISLFLILPVLLQTALLLGYWWSWLGKRPPPTPTSLWQSHTCTHTVHWLAEQFYT